MATTHRLEPRTEAGQENLPSTLPSQLPGCEDLEPLGGSQLAVPGPGTANDSELHAGILLEFLPIGDQFELAETGVVCRGCSEVMDQDAVAASFQLLRQMESRR